MFLSRRTVESAPGDEKDMKSCRSVITKTVEKTGGVRTTTTTFKSCTRDGIDAALAKLDIDPLKFRSGGTSVSKTIVYTDSSGHREVLEETVENYGDPDKIKQKEVSEDGCKKMGTCFGKTNSGSSTGDSKSDHEVKKPVRKENSDHQVGGDSSLTGDFELDCLRAHNDYRSKHGVPPLKLSKEMNAYAQEWADHLAKTDSFQHRTHDKKYGENIYMKWSSDPNYVVSGKEAVDSWYSEIKDYTFGREPTSLRSGHFTQVVWKGSNTLGVGRARSRSGKILVVANYDPAGNFIGRFNENVPLPIKA